MLRPSYLRVTMLIVLVLGVSAGLSAAMAADLLHVEQHKAHSLSWQQDGWLQQ